MTGQFIYLPQILPQEVWSTRNMGSLPQFVEIVIIQGTESTPCDAVGKNKEAEVPSAGDRLLCRGVFLFLLAQDAHADRFFCLLRS